MIVKEAPHPPQVKEPQVVTKEPQVVTKEPQVVTKEKQTVAEDKPALAANAGTNEQATAAGCYEGEGAENNDPDKRADTTDRA